MTIGRQGLHVTEPVVKELIETKPTYKNKAYCEELLTEYFGANIVESIDNSAYEKATHIHNMNEPLPQNLIGKYNTVIDAGCLEHIFNVPQALKNCSLFCKPGGQIIHILPANNQCGHGFWQFSPELFFSLYSTENGYDETEIFLADLSNTKEWYQVHQPTNGQRVNVITLKSLSVLVRTVLREKHFTHANVQQSDYIYQWNAESKNYASVSKSPRNVIGINQVLKKIPFVYKLLSPTYHYYLQTRRGMGLNGRNPGLYLITVKTFIQSN